MNYDEYVMLISSFCDLFRSISTLFESFSRIKMLQLYTVSGYSTLICF